MKKIMLFILTFTYAIPEHIPKLAPIPEETQLALIDSLEKILNNDYFVFPHTIDSLEGLSAFIKPKHPHYKHITFTGLKHVPEKTFDHSHFRELQGLVIKNGTLTNLPQDLLAYSPKLQDVDFSNNKLTTLPEGFFSTTRTLKWVNLTGNNFSKEEQKRVSKEIQNNNSDIKLILF